MPNTPDQIAINEFEGAKDIPKISMEGFMTGAFRVCIYIDINYYYNY